MDTDLAELAQRSLEALRRAEILHPEVVVSPAAPVLYFGDLDVLLRSEMRVVTVGLNPSRLEFPDGEPFVRFPGAKSFSADGGARAYLEALNRYFDTSPYGSWFGTFEPLLNGMGASYYAGSPNTAIHTDLCSPVATDPTWSRLSHSQREALIGDGRPLWHDLIRKVRPHVMLISVARLHLAGIDFPRAGDRFEIARLEARRRRPYRVEGWWMEIAGGFRSLVVFGQAAQRPFGTVGAHDKEIIGARVREVLDGR